MKKNNFDERYKSLNQLPVWELLNMLYYKDYLAMKDVIINKIIDQDRDLLYNGNDDHYFEKEVD